MSTITTLNDWITANSFRTQTNTNFSNLNTDKQETSWKDASGGYAWLTLFKINFKNVANTFTSFFTNTNTSSRTYTFQDRDGTIADNTDLALKWDKSGNLSQFASTTSAQLAWVISDETGSGSLVFANTPTLVTPNIGVATGTSVIFTNDAITASGNAATIPVTHRLHTVTNNSAATLTITITTAGATDWQLHMIRILDFSAVAQTITWVNTENSDVTAPVLSNGSTTLPRTVGFQYNWSTSKWRCIANA